MVKEYVVASVRGRPAQWAVHVGDKLYGTYLSEFAALQDAVDAAYEDGQSGSESRVSVRYRDKERDAVKWTYGDAYPYETASESTEG